MQAKAHLVSFADGAFKNRRQGFTNEALSMNFFESVNVLDRKSLDTCYFEKHGRYILSQKRGFGYWIWKSQVVHQSLANLPENDVLAFSDVGFKFNPDGRYRLLEYVEMCCDSEFKNLGFSNTHTEYCRTKADLACRLNVDLSSIVMRSTQLSSGFFFLINNKRNRDLVKSWVDISIENNYHYSNDSPSELPNHPQFIEHRHDQSIFSLLRKLSGCEVTHYEVQSYPHFDNLKGILPLFAARQGRDKSYVPEM